MWGDATGRPPRVARGVVGFEGYGLKPPKDSFSKLTHNLPANQVERVAAGRLG